MTYPPPPPQTTTCCAILLPARHSNIFLRDMPKELMDYANVPTRIHGVCERDTTMPHNSATDHSTLRSNLARIILK